MKKIGLYLVLIAAVSLFGENRGAGKDVGKLQPVQVIVAEWTEGKLRLTTDTGHTGVGASVEKALADMKEAASGEIFLDTADYLLIRKSALHVLNEFDEYLRPSCAVCTLTGTVEGEKAAEYLSYHIPAVTMAMYEAGEEELPQLISEEGRMKLVQ